jgi:hypothetical protein
MTTNYEKILIKAISLIKDLEQLGKLLLQVQNELTGAEYRQLEKDLLNQRVTREKTTQADLQAAIGIATGEFDKRLFKGIASSKIISLSPRDHQRLLSGEKFELINTDYTTHWKSWYEMTDTEKGQLLGPKGGYIHLSSDQKIYKRQLPKPTPIHSASYRHRTLVFIARKKQTSIQLGELICMLYNNQELETFLNDLTTIRTEMKGN